MADGFLGRWSRRKLEVKEAPPAATQRPTAELPAVQPSTETVRGDEPPEQPPPLTLEDVKSLTAESDFSRFTAADVTPEVKNAALKKLFADPRYNVMDRMDVYIDDYSQPDPLPESMLRQLASARFLGLFKDEEAEGKEGPRDDANDPTAQTVAKSDPVPPAVPEPDPHADPDLRLQQDDAAAGEDPGRGDG